MKEKNVVIGIDPGMQGGLAVNYQGATTVIKMPTIFTEIFDVFQECINNVGTKNITVYLEDVGKHMYGNNASSSAKFARHCGHLEMALYALKLSVIPVLPTKWQKCLYPLTHGMTKEAKAKRKHEIKQKMMQKYTKLKVTLWNSDALGILTYGIQQGEK